MKFLQISILIILITLSSCSLHTTKNLTERKSTIPTVKNRYFSDSEKDYIYKTSIDIYGNNFSGIMIFKKINKNHHRIVFTTEFGNKIFDFELINNQFKKNFILDKLDKKIIVNTLQNDFKILLQESSKVVNSYTNANHYIYKTLQKKRYNFYFISKKNKLLTQITHTTKTKEKINFFFSEIENNVSKKITIQHKNIKLNINLNFLTN